jgi:hypothetical protein
VVLDGIIEDVVEDVDVACLGESVYEGIEGVGFDFGAVVVFHVQICGFIEFLGIEEGLEPGID